MTLDRDSRGSRRHDGVRGPAGRPETRAAGRARRIALSLLPPVAATLVFSVTIAGEFVSDDTLIAGDEELQSFDLERIFRDHYWGKLRFDIQYRPLILLSYALNWQLSPSPAGFHAVNVLLNAAVAWVVFLILRELLRDDVLASLGATLYAVLPIHVEAVAWVVGRAELVAALAVLGAWLIVLRRPETKLAPALWAAPIVFLGLCAKENAAVAVPVFLASGWALRKRHHLLARRSAVAAGAALLAVGLYWILRSWALAEEFRRWETGGATLLSRVDNPLHWNFSDHAARVLNALRLQGLYLWKTVVPLHLSADYSYNQLPVLPPGSPRLWLEVAAVIVLLVGGTWYFSRRRRAAAFLGVLFFPTAFLVTSNVLFPIGTIFAERLAYLPSLAYPVVLCSVLGESVGREGRRRRAALAALAALITLYAWRSVQQSLEWTDLPTLYAATAEASPRSARAQLLGATAAIVKARKSEDAAVKRALYARALEHARRAREIAPFHGAALGRMAQTYLFRGKDLGNRDDFARAEEHYTRAIEIQRRHDLVEPDYYLERGEARMRLGKFGAASRDFDRYIRSGRSRRALEEAKAYNFRGLCRGVLADHLEGGAEAEAQTGAEARARRLRELAREDFDRAIRLYPAEPGFYANRGFLRFRSGDPEGAIEDYRRGLALCREQGHLYLPPPEDSVWRFRQRIAEVHESTGDPEAAAREHERAAELRGDG